MSVASEFISESEHRLTVLDLLCPVISHNSVFDHILCNAFHPDLSRKLRLLSLVSQLIRGMPPDSSEVTISKVTFLQELLNIANKSVCSLIFAVL